MILSQLIVASTISRISAVTADYLSQPVMASIISRLSAVTADDPAPAVVVTAAGLDDGKNDISSCSPGKQQQI